MVIRTKALFVFTLLDFRYPIVCITFFNVLLGSVGVLGVGFRWWKFMFVRTLKRYTTTYTKRIYFSLFLSVLFMVQTSSVWLLNLRRPKNQYVLRSSIYTPIALTCSLIVHSSFPYILSLQL